MTIKYVDSQLTSLFAQTANVKIKHAANNS